MITLKILGVDFMKFTVTEALVSYIKEKRKEQNINVTTFAQKIGKSKSYITKFDNCEFKTLTVEAFNEIFEAISETKEQSIELMDEYFLSLIKNKYVDKNIDLMVDVSNYSNIVKEIKVRENLIKKFNKMLESKNLSIHDIVEFANSNDPVKTYSNFDSVEYNEYVAPPLSASGEGSEQKVYIKINLDEDFVSSILTGNIDTCNYFTLLAITNAYYRIELLKSETLNIKENADKIAGLSARNLLFNFHIYSLEDYYKIQTSNDNIKELSVDLSNVSHSIQGTLGGYMNLIAKIYYQNPFYIEDKVLGFRENLEADAPFCIAAMDLPFYKVKKFSTDNKKKLLKEITAIIDRYADDEEYQEQIDLI